MYEQLQQFAGCSFNQDFDLEYANPDEAISAFGSGHEHQSVTQLLSEIGELLESSLSEAEIDDLWISELGASYDPRVDGLTYREWVAHVRDLLTRARDNS